jgi:hypothetical protein
MTDFIKIDTARLNEIKEAAKGMDYDRAHEYDLKILLEAYKTIEGALNEVKSAYKEQFKDYPSKSVEGDYVRVMTYQAGAKYAAADVQSIDPKFLRVELEPKAVEAYVKLNQRLPDGVEYKERAIAVKISLKAK